MLNTRRLLKAAWAYGKNESQWIIIDENIKIRYFKSYSDEMYTIHVVINGIEVLTATNHGGLFGIYKDKLYKIPKPAEQELNSWASDILSANRHISRTYRRKKNARHRENQDKVNSPYQQ